MKSALLHKLPINSEASFVFQRLNCAYFDKPWHYHKEYEIVLINQGSGIRFIGDNVSQFKKNDLCLIGSDIPHLFKSDKSYYTKSLGIKSQSTFVHFTRDFLGNTFFDIPEMYRVKELLNKSSLAIEIYGEVKEYIIGKLNKMINASPAHRLSDLLQILIELSESNEWKTLLSNSYTINNYGDTKRINRAFEFILKNYDRKIYQEEIASKLNMSIPAFSRYFKQHTQKTFSGYVTEIRISNACRLLMERDYNITEICYLSGFENRSNFYRHFKKSTGVIPSEYRDRFFNAIQ